MSKSNKCAETFAKAVASHATAEFGVYIGFPSIMLSRPPLLSFDVRRRRQRGHGLGLQHDFLLLDREADGEWELGRFHHDPRAIHLHDDLVRYMGDTLEWVPTVNPARREPHSGLCMWGPTLIEAEGAAVAERVFSLWAELFAVGPPLLSLTGNYSWVVPHDATPAGERVTQLEGGYDRLEFDRDEVVGVLRQMATWCGRVSSGGGRLYLYHFGV